MIRKLLAFVRLHKEQISLVGSVGAVVLSVYTYVVGNLWDVHDVQVYVRGDIQSNIQDLPIHVILVNRGKRTEVVLATTLALRRKDEKGIEDVKKIEFSPTPTVLERSAVVPVQLPGTKAYLNRVNTGTTDAQGLPTYWAKDQSVEYGVAFEYIDAKGTFATQFMPIGQVTFKGGKAVEFDSTAAWGNTPRRLL